MAQITATFDTVTKAFTLTRDGVPVTDLESVCFSTYGCCGPAGEPPVYSMSLCRRVADRANKTHTSEHTSAAAGGDFKKVK
jgi:hypothetical protein